MKRVLFGRRAGPLLVFLLAGAVISVGVVAVLLGGFTATKGGYIVIGIVFAIGFYYRTRLDPSTNSRWESARTPEAIRRFGPRFVGLVAVWAVGISVVTGDRALALLVGLPVGFGLLALCAIAGVGARTLVIEAVALYGASSVSKYLTTGFYFGSGDTLFHTHNVETLVRTGSVAALPRYKFFPGFDVLNGAITMLGDISAYDAILPTGIVTYGVVVCCAFLLVRAATGDERLGAFAAVGLVMTGPFLFYATYFFPQSLAVALVVFGLYVAYRANQARETRVRYSLIGLALAATLVLTHQLTIVLFVPLVGVLFAVAAALKRVASEGHTPLRQPRGYLAATVGVASVSYWAYRSPFLGELSSAVRTTASLALFTSDSGAPTPTIALGTELPALTVGTALRSLYSTGGIYQITLLVVFLLGVATVIDRTRTYWSALPLLSVGAVGSVLIFRTPLTLPGLDRLQLPATLFFAVVIGVGLYRLSRSGTRNTATLVAVVVLVSAVGTAAPLTVNAGDDLYELNAGPNLYELYPTPQPQKAYSDAEYRDLESIAAFVERHNATLYTFSVDYQAMDGFGVESESAGVAESGIETGAGVLLYRRAFAHHRLSYTIHLQNGVVIGTVIIAPDWLNATVATQNKIYAAGEGGLLWNPNGSLIAPGRQPTRVGNRTDRDPPIRGEESTARDAVKRTIGGMA